MKKNFYFSLLLFLLTLGGFVGCTDKVDDSNLYTFTGETLTDYINGQANLSDFSYIISKVRLSSTSQSTLDKLLSTRGHYTAFIPTNDAVQHYLDSVYNTTNYDIKTIPDSTAENIAKSCVIDNGADDAYLSTSFEASGALEKTNMNGRFITIDFDTISNSIIVNTKSRITVKDVEVENGVAYQVNRVLAPSTATLPSLMSQVSNMKIFTHLLEETGWGNQMQKYRTFNYEGYNTYEDYVAINPTGPGIPSDKTIQDNPTHRNYGYTVFAEPDNLLQQKWGFTLHETNGIVDNWDEVMTAVKKACAEYYPSATSSDLKSEDNAVNQFISYHLLKGGIPYNKLVIHYNEIGFAYTKENELTIDAWEYYETMGSQRRLIKITEGSQTGGKRINRHCTYDLNNYKEQTVDIPGTLISSNNGTEDNNALNGYYYPIDDILVYDSKVPQTVLNERLRFDVASLNPELVTNGFRRPAIFKKYHIPPAYLDNWTFTAETEPHYLSGYGVGWYNYQGDEFNISGQYDMTLKLPPVPNEGTYELRYGCSNNTLRGMCQVYLGTDKTNLSAVGLPLDLRLVATNPAIGFVTDVADDEETNTAIDKTMRNHGYMKSPMYYGADSKTGVSVSLRNLRPSEPALRKIIWTGTMSPGKTYYMRLKSVLESTGTELYVDYIELVPKSVYNGTSAEDRW